MSIPISSKALKDTPVVEDSVYLNDSENSNALRRVLISVLMTMRQSLKGLYTAQQVHPAVALTDAATINWNLDAAQNAKVTLGGNRTLALPTNIVDGGLYTLEVTQDGTGNRTLTFASGYLWAGGTAPTLSTAAGAVDVLSFRGKGTTQMQGVINKDFS